MKNLLLCFALLGLLTACASDPYKEHFRQTGMLHPELLQQHSVECLNYGFQPESEDLAECRMELAQSWKDNREAAQRVPRGNAGIGYGYGAFGSQYGYGIGHRF